MTDRSFTTASGDQTSTEVFDAVTNVAGWWSTEIDGATFEISEKNGQSEVSFTHHGPVPDRECFEFCSTGWSFYINTSLQNLISTGEGQPNGTGRPRLATEEPASRWLGKPDQPWPAASTRR